MFVINVRSPMYCAGFTGIDQDYEAPLNPELILRAGEQSIDECVQELVQLLQKRVRHVTTRLAAPVTGSVLKYMHGRLIVWQRDFAVLDPDRTVSE
jgi:hypothetical protein